MAKKKPERRHYGRRAEGQTQTTISLSETLFNEAKEHAANNGTTLSKLVEELLAAQLPTSVNNGEKGKK